ncbi:outer membrane protein [Bradyrhizobium sp. WSM1743]|uniref:outer membrane protein n=1 Tax=Bradyrhizobium sp. WSM1743 TaxID=318996 RepID=UPI001FDA39D6|nr:outer membrane beta-barrel protein [Bradyrhizobium sp. WSM1743]
MRSGVLVYGAAVVSLATCSLANSADLTLPTRVSSTLWSWTGGYVGFHGGGGYGRTSFTDPYGPSIYGDNVNTPTFLAGGQIGYNWQSNGWVLGAELDVSHAVSDGTNSCLAFSGNVVIATCKAGPNVFVTGTARVGYTFGARGRTLTYVKGGAAWQNNRGSIANNNEFRHDESPGFPRHTTQFDYGRFGWTVGFGVEQALTAAWSLKFEYDYMRFAGPHLATPPTMQYPPLAVIPASASDLSSSYQVGKVGLNYHFGSSPSEPQWSHGSLVPDRGWAGHRAYPDAWSIEGGSRVWIGRGTFQWDYNLPPPMPGEGVIPSSRLTYHGLDGISGELFARLDSPWGIFMRAMLASDASRRER